MLPQIELFNQKLEQAQKEMGKNINEFIPVKYSNISEDGESNPAFRLAVGAAFVLLCVQVYRTLHGGKSGSGGITGGLGGKGGLGGGQNPMG